MKALVVVGAAAPSVGAGVVGGAGSASTRKVVKSPTIVSPAASASRHDTVQAPLGTGVLIGIVTISPSASTSGLPVSWGCDGVPQASTTIGRSSLLQLLVEREHDRRRRGVERGTVGRVDRLQ